MVKERRFTKGSTKVTIISTGHINHQNINVMMISDSDNDDDDDDDDDDDNGDGDDTASSTKMVFKGFFWDTTYT